MIDLSLVVLPGRNLTNPLMYFPLGLLYIAASVRQAGYKVNIIDLRDAKRVYQGQIPTKVGMVGFTSTTGEVEDAKYLARKQNIHINILGGAHATLLTEDCGEFDVVVRGEGERVILDILKGKTGIIQAKRITDLDSLPRPAWDMIPRSRLFSRELFPGEKYGKGEPAATVIFSRGCLFNCHFCANALKSPITYHSPSRAADDIQYLRDTYNIHYFRLADDNITLNRPWFTSLMEAISKLNIRFKCHTRPDLLDKDRAELLARAGCEELGFGAESGDDRVLVNMNKGFTVEDTVRAVEVTKQVGIRAKTYLIAGLPGETEESIALTMRMMIQAKPDKWTLSRFTPYPGCEIWKSPSRFGVYLDGKEFSDYWNFYETPPYHLYDVSSYDLTFRYKQLYSWLKTEEYKNV